MKTLLLFVVSLIVAAPLWAGKPKVEPDYGSGTPLYGKVAFDLEGKTVAWAVLVPAKDATVLYFDRDADGDLTEESERFESSDHRFSIGEFTDPNGDVKHTDLSLRYDPKDGDVMFSLKWKGGEKVAGGYAPAPGPYMPFAEDPEKAPTIQPIGEGPFAVQPWMIDPLMIGDSTDVKFFLGHAGKGKHAFCAVRQTFLPEKDGLKATLIYNTVDGEEKQTVHKLLDRC